MTLEQRLDHVRSGCLLDWRGAEAKANAHHVHDVAGLVRLGYATDDGKSLPRLTVAGLEEWRRLGRVRIHGDDPEGR